MGPNNLGISFECCGNFVKSHAAATQLVHIDGTSPVEFVIPSFDGPSIIWKTEKWGQLDPEKFLNIQQCQ